eukprot:GHVU01180221.1.p1 GENE.GHVU01180221.1~~GHVU01180221.1.p1  ORF type:complete len:449 (+),score=62.28 GHVU01180221.1:105-1451(+)
MNQRPQPSPLQSLSLYRLLRCALYRRQCVAGLKDNSDKHVRKVIAQKNQKRCRSVCSKEKGVTTTAIVCCNALGHYMPPHIVHGQLKQVRKDNQINGPEGAYYSVSESGWVDADIFFAWANEFVRFTGACEERPKVLVMDNLEAHCDIWVLEYLAAHCVHVVGLPSHTSHVLQPLDVSVFRTFKEAYNLEVKAVMDRGEVMLKRNVAECLARAWGAATPFSNAVSGFKKTGIYPFNRRAIPDSDLDIGEETLLRYFGPVGEPGASHAAANDASAGQTVSLPREVPLSPSAAGAASGNSGGVVVAAAATASRGLSACTEDGDEVELVGATPLRGTHRHSAGLDSNAPVPTPEAMRLPARKTPHAHKAYAPAYRKGSEIMTSPAYLATARQRETDKDTVASERVRKAVTAEKLAEGKATVAKDAADAAAAEAVAIADAAEGNPMLGEWLQ